MRILGLIWLAAFALSAGAAPLSVTSTGEQSGAGDTPALQAALATIGADTVGDTRELQLCGHYRINALLALVFNHTLPGQQPLRIHGCAQTTITQLGSNVGILEFQVPDNASPHDVFIDGITFSYATQQNCVTQPASVAIGVRDTISPTPNGTLFGLYLRDSSIVSACRGLANTQPAGLFAVWMVDITHVDFWLMNGAAVWLLSPTSVGQPNIALNGPNYITCSGGTEPLVRIDGADSLSIRNLEANGCNDRTVMSISGAISYSIAASKIETATYTQNATPILDMENSMGSVDGFLASNLTLSASNLVLLNTGAGNSGQSNTARNLTILVKSGTGTINFASSGAQRLYLLDAPHIWSRGTGPATVQLLDNAASASANFVNLVVHPGGAVSDDIGDNSIALFGLTSPQEIYYNSRLTKPQTVTLPTSTAAKNCLWDGIRYRIVRSIFAGGAPLTILGLANPPIFNVNPGSVVEVEWHRSSGWAETFSARL